MLLFMKEIARRIIEKINFHDSDSILLDSSDANNFIVNKDNFFSLSNVKSNKRIAFVDGGNLEIFASPSISLFFNRVYYTIYQKNKRIKNRLFEFFTLISSEKKEERIFFKTEYFSTKNKIALEEFYFDSFDKNLVTGNRRAEISQIGNVIRRFSELSVINEIEADYVILDGTLEANYPYEKEILDSIKPPIFGLAKTTSLITSQGNSAAATISSMTKNDSWGYYLGEADAKSHDAFIYFLKLSNKSDYVFRFEAKKQTEVNVVVSLLEKNSKDPIFPGYPYGLIEADMFARVSNKEKEALVLQLNILFGKDIKKIKPYLNSANAHDVLDSIS